jgi:hypothetical protein
MTLAYLSHLPKKLIRRMAGFSKDEGSYTLPRSHVKPPVSLAKQIWPWIDGWLKRTHARAQGKDWKAGGLPDDDQAAAGFLKLLLVLRDVFLQDAALLQLRFPELPLWQHSVFQHADWHQFASRVRLTEVAASGEQEQATVLRQAMPLLAEAVYQSRDSVLAAVREQFRELGNMKATLNCLAQSHLHTGQKLLDQLWNLGQPTDSGIQVSYVVFV